MKTIIGVIGADVHAVGNRIIEYVLKDAGFKVINLGLWYQRRVYKRSINWMQTLYGYLLYTDMEKLIVVA